MVPLPLWFQSSPPENYCTVPRSLSNSAIDLDKHQIEESSLIRFNKTDKFYVLTWTETFFLQCDDLESSECHVKYLETRETSTKHASTSWPLTNDYRVISCQSISELPNISLCYWIAIDKQSRQASSVVVSSGDIVPRPRFKSTTNQRFHSNARPFTRHQPEVELV